MANDGTVFFSITGWGYSFRPIIIDTLTRLISLSEYDSKLKQTSCRCCLKRISWFLVRLQLSKGASFHMFVYSSGLTSRDLPRASGLIKIVSMISGTHIRRSEEVCCMKSWFEMVVKSSELNWRICFNLSYWLEWIAKSRPTIWINMMYCTPRLPTCMVAE